MKLTVKQILWGFAHRPKARRGQQMREAVHTQQDQTRNMESRNGATDQKQGMTLTGKHLVWRLTDRSKARIGTTGLKNRIFKGGEMRRAMQIHHTKHEPLIAGMWQLINNKE